MCLYAYPIGIEYQAMYLGMSIQVVLVPTYSYFLWVLSITHPYIPSYPLHRPPINKQHGSIEPPLPHLESRRSSMTIGSLSYTSQPRPVTSLTPYLSSTPITSQHQMHRSNSLTARRTSFESHAVLPVRLP